MLGIFTHCTQPRTEYELPPREQISAHEDESGRRTEPDMASGLDFILSLCAADPSPPPSPIHPRSPIPALRRPNLRRRDFGRGWLEVGAPHFSPSLLDLSCPPHLDPCSRVYGTLPTSPFFFHRWNGGNRGKGEGEGGHIAWAEHNGGRLCAPRHPRFCCHAFCPTSCH